MLVAAVVVEADAGHSSLHHFEAVAEVAVEYCLSQEVSITFPGELKIHAVVASENGSHAYLAVVGGNFLLTVLIEKTGCLVEEVLVVADSAELAFPVGLASSHRTGATAET